MKALTLIQPWASLIAWLEKLIESRSWYTAYRGPLAIHAAKGIHDWAEELMRDEPFRSAIARHAEPIKGSLFRVAEMPRGSILCVGNLVNVVRVQGLGWPKLKATMSDKEMKFGDYTEGRFAWVLEDVQTLVSPIDVRGAQGLWEVTDDVRLLLGEQLQEGNLKRTIMQDPLQGGEGVRAG